MSSEIKNRSAYHDYFIEDKYDAGMVLAGTEVKSIREGKVNFVDSFCAFHQGELWVKNMHIAEYRLGTTNNHIAVHDRKLLLTRRQCIGCDVEIVLGHQVECLAQALGYNEPTLGHVVFRVKRCLLAFG